MSSIEPTCRYVLYLYLMPASAAGKLAMADYSDNINRKGLHSVASKLQYPRYIYQEIDSIQSFSPATRAFPELSRVEIHSQMQCNDQTKGGEEVE